MALYTKTVNFLAKDSLPLNNAAKYLKGSELDAEFNNIATADADNLKESALGTGVETALGVNVGSAGAPVLFNGALGTPSSGTLTNATGLPAAGVTGTALVAAAIGTTVQAYDATLTAFAGGLTAAGKIPYATALNTLGELDFKDEDNMVSDSATAVPSQQSVKAYADTKSIVLGTPQATTSGTSIDFTGIPAGTKRITISFIGVSTSGSSALIVQLGDSGGVETTGYLGAAGQISTPSVGNITTGLPIQGAAAASSVMHGAINITLENAATFTWASFSLMGLSNSAQIYLGAGSKSLSAELDRVRITTVGGTDTLDAGEINISYQ